LSPFFCSERSVCGKILLSVYDAQKNYRKIFESAATFRHA
jgi:hypothetical protein